MASDMTSVVTSFLVSRDVGEERVRRQSGARAGVSRRQDTAPPPRTRAARGERLDVMRYRHFRSHCDSRLLPGDSRAIYWVPARLVFTVWIFE